MARSGRLRRSAEPHHRADRPTNRSSSLGSGRGAPHPSPGRIRKRRAGSMFPSALMASQSGRQTASVHSRPGEPSPHNSDQASQAGRGKVAAGRSGSISVPNPKTLGPRSSRIRTSDRLARSRNSRPSIRDSAALHETNSRPVSPGRIHDHQRSEPMKHVYVIRANPAEHTSPGRDVKPSRTPPARTPR